MRNLYDFDNTIYKHDSSFKFYMFCIKFRPVLFFRLLYVFVLYCLNALHIISTKVFKERVFSYIAKLKNVDEIVEKFWQKQTKNISAWYLTNRREDDVICSASPEFLVAACFKTINPTATIVATKMNKQTGKIEGENCKGEEKVNRLKQIFSDENLKFNAVYTDSLSDFPILDLTENKFIVCGGKVYEFKKQKPTLLNKIKYFIKQMRVTHYIKNGLIFMPLVFSLNFFNARLFCDVLIATISFCLMNSCVYILNDVKDAKADRLHSSKRKRPIAGYMIKWWEALIFAALLLALSITINIFALGFNWAAFAILLGYFLLNLAYSFYLKSVPLVELFILAGCYMLRLFYGGVVISVSISSWLYLTVLSASLFMGFIKRRNEIMFEGTSTRKVSKSYTVSFLDKNAYITMALTLAFYSLWAVSHINEGFITTQIGKIMLLISIPLVYFILMRYSMEVERKNSGNPMEVLIKCSFLMLAVVIYVVLIILALYVCK